MEYLDEEVPELEVREYIGKGDHGSTNVYTDGELITYIFHLLRTVLKDIRDDALQQRAIQIATLIKNSNTKIPYKLPFKLTINATRKDYEEILHEFIDAIESANKEDSYVQRIQTLKTIYFPLESDSSKDTITNTEVYLEENTDSSKILDDESFETTVTKMYKRSILSSVLTLKERIEYKPTVGDEMKYDVNEFIPNWTTVEKKLKELEILPTFDDLITLLESNGFPYDTLNIDHWKSIVDIIEKLPDNDEDETSPKHSKSKESLYDIGSLPYINLLKAMQDSPITLSTVGQQQSIIGSYPSNVQVSGRVDTLLSEIINSSLSIESLIQTIGDRITQERQIKLTRFLNEWAIITEEVIQEKLIAYLERSEELKNSINTPTIMPISIAHELHDITEGDNVRNYEGMTNGDEEMLFSNTEAGEVFSVMEEDEAFKQNKDPLQSILPISTILTKETANEKGICNGSYEILSGCHMRLFGVLQDAGFIDSFDQSTLSDIYLSIGSTLQIASIEDAFISDFPTLEKNVIELLTKTIVNGQPYPHIMMRPIIAMDLKSRWHSLEKIYNKELVVTFTRLFAMVVLVLLRKSLTGTLTFDPLQGMISTISLYSPFGIPLEGSSDKEGILVYLCAVCEKNVNWVLLYPRLDASTFMKRIIALIPTDRSLMPVLQDIQTIYKTFHKDEQSVVDVARLSLIEALEKGDKGRILPNYIKVLLLLPRMIAAPKRGSIIGCCVQPLNETFKADQDIIQKKLKALIAVKDKYAKGKKIIRGRLSNYTQEVEKKTHKEVPLPNKITTFERLELSYKEWSEKFIEGIDDSFLKDKIDTLWTRLVKKTGKNNKEANQWFLEQSSIDSLGSILPKWIIILRSRGREHPSELVYLDAMIETFKFIKERLALIQYPVDSVKEATHQVRLYLLNALLFQSDYMTENVVVQSLFDIILTIGKMNFIPPISEFGKVIADLREKLKVKALSVLDVQTDEDRSLLITLKELGIHDYVKDANVYEEDESTYYTYKGQDEDRNEDEIGDDDLYD